MDDVELSIGSSSSNDCDSGNNKMTDKVCGLKYNTCLQPTDPQHAENELSVATAEGQTPLDLMLDKNAKMLAFPCKFSVHCTGVTDERDVKLTPREYFSQQVILNKEERCASDPNYSFCVQNRNSSEMTTFFS
jgi:hypothetical protein